MVLILIFFGELNKSFGNYDKIKKINKILYLAIQSPNRLTAKIQQYQIGLFIVQILKMVKSG